MHLVDAYDTVVPVPGTERMPVIDYEPLVLPFIVDDRMVPGPGSHFRVLLQDLADPLERSERIVGYRIGNAIVRSCPSSLGPHEIILSVLQEHERPLDIVLRSDLLEQCAVIERNESGKVVVQLADIAVPPAAVIHIPGTVLVLEHELVDRLCPVDDLVYERFAEQVLVGSLRTVRNGDAYAALPFLVHIIASEEEVIGLVLMNYGRRPHGLPYPFHLVIVDDAFVLRPIDEVPGRKCVQVSLLLVREGCRRENPVFLPENGSFRIGVLPRKNRVAGAPCGRTTD